MTDQAVQRRSPGLYLVSAGHDPMELKVNYSAPVPLQVTQALVAGLQDEYGKGLSEDTVWDWSVARRLQELLRLVESRGATRLEFSCDCSKCHETFSLELATASFRQQPHADSLSVDTGKGETLQLRLPTGRDQMQWQGKSWTPEKLASRLLDQGRGKQSRLGKKKLERISAALEAADPLTALQLDTVCPACGSPQAIPFDLEASLLKCLQSQATDLMHKVHRLASHYHWSEQTILDLPRHRLDFYLSCISRSRS